MRRGLEATDPLWPGARKAYGWVHRAAQLLDNEAQRGVLELRRAYRRGRVWALLRRVALNLLRGRLFLWEPTELLTARAQAVAAAPLAVLLFLAGL